MKKENENLIPVCVYCDSTGLFSETECERENLTDMMFPEWIVREWYKENEKDFIEECKIDSLKEPCFETWLNEVYTADDTDGLYDFAVEKEFDPTFGNEVDSQHNALVFEDSNYEYETIVVFKGTTFECRKWAKKHDWKYKYSFMSFESLEWESKEVDLEMLFY